MGFVLSHFPITNGCPFISAWISPFNTFCKSGLVLMNSFSCCLTGKLSPLQFCMTTLPSRGFLIKGFFFFQHFAGQREWDDIFKVSAEKSDGLMEFLVCNKLLFLGACKIFFSSLTLTFYVSWWGSLWIHLLWNSEIPGSGILFCSTG